jgi:hypothetical protein
VLDKVLLALVELDPVLVVLRQVNLLRRPERGCEKESGFGSVCACV